MKWQNRTQYAILGLLTIQPLSGYDIKKLVQKSISHFWSESNGQLYPTLKILKRLKWISSEESDKKVIYSITLLGKESLERWLLSNSAKHIYRNETLLKLFFGMNIPKEESICKLEYKKKVIKEHLKQCSLTLKELDKNSPHYIYWLISLNYGIMTMRANLKWCNESIKLLKRKS